MDMKMDFFQVEMWDCWIKKQPSIILYCASTGERNAGCWYCTHAVSSLTVLWVMAFGCWLAFHLSPAGRWALCTSEQEGVMKGGGKEEGREERWAWDCLCLKRFFFFHIWPSLHLIFILLLHNNSVIDEHLWVLNGSEVRGKRSWVSFGKEEEQRRSKRSMAL